MQANFVEVVRFGFLGATFLVWTPVGFFVWVPFLIRMCFVLVASILQAALGRTNTQHLAEPLKHAMGFWFTGYQMAHLAVYPDKNATASATDVPSDGQKISNARVFGEICWAVIVWCAFISPAIISWVRYGPPPWLVGQ